MTHSLCDEEYICSLLSACRLWWAHRITQGVTLLALLRIAFLAGSFLINNVFSLSR